MYDSPFAGLFSGLGRTVTGMLKDVPNDQLGARAFELAKSGLVSFDKALAIKYLADRITKSGSMQGPPPGNVMNDLQMKIRSAITGQPMPQQMPPQGAMPPGMPPPGAMPPGMPPPGAMPPGAPPPGAMPPPPPPAMMNAGLATLPAPALEGPPPGAPGMAAGGIVAFQEGGDIEMYPGRSFDPFTLVPDRSVRIPLRAADNAVEEPTEEESATDIDTDTNTTNSLLTEYLRGMRSPEGLTGIEARQRELSQSPKIADYAEYLRQQRELEEKSGLGEALKMQRDLLQGRGAELEKNIAEKQKLAKVTAGFAMAERAGQANASFLDALTAGLSHYARSKGELKDRELQLREAIQDKEIAAQLAEEGATREAMQAARQQREADLARGEQRQARGDELAIRLAQLGLEKTRLGVSLLSAQARGVDVFKLIQTQLYNNRLEMAKTKDPAKLKELEEKEISLQATADAIMPASQQARQGMLNREAAQLANAQRAFDKLHGPAMQNLIATISAMESNPEADQTKLSEYRQQLANLQQQRDQLGAQPGVTEWDDLEGI